jgi:alpha-ketoglutarate-dependent taurine dioxygenase
MKKLRNCGAIREYTATAFGENEAREAKQQLAKGLVVYLRDCEPSPDFLFDFSRWFGNPMEKLSFKYKFTDSRVMQYVGNVSVKRNIAKAERMDTNDHEPITVHTARSYAHVRPDYFALLMADAGLVDVEPGNRGESLLSRWEDVFAAYARRHASAAQDIELLLDTPVSYRPWYYAEGPVTTEPMLQRRQDGSLAIRYWNQAPETLAKLLGEESELVRVVRQLDVIANDQEVMMEFQMERGEMYVIDNALVGHARRGFVDEKLVGDSVLHNSRQLYSLHLQSSGRQ